MINRVVLIGRLTKDPELRTTQSGISVASFILAVDRNHRRGEDKQADFISCVIWRKAAETFCQYTHKGSKVGIEGRLQTRQYESKNGNTVFVTEVVVDNFAFLSSKKDQGSSTSQSVPDPQRQASNATRGTLSDDDIEHLSADDLPF